MRDFHFAPTNESYAVPQEFLLTVRRSYEGPMAPRLLKHVSPLCFMLTSLLFFLCLAAVDFFQLKAHPRLMGLRTTAASNSEPSEGEVRHVMTALLCARQVSLG